MHTGQPLSQPGVAGMTIRGAVNGINEAPPAVPRLEMAADRLESCLQELYGRISRLQNIADRTLGPTPETQEKAPEGGGIPLTLPRLFTGLEAFEFLLRRLDAVTQRLEAL